MRRLLATLLLVLVCALPVAAQSVFIATVVIGMSTRPGDTYTFSPVPVPTGVHGLQVILDVSQATDPLPALSAILEGSLDGGNTWMSAGSFSRPVGPRGLTFLGVTVTALQPTFHGGDFWSDTTNVNRRLRGSATIGGTMRFSMTVQPLSD